MRVCTFRVCECWLFPFFPCPKTSRGHPGCRFPMGCHFHVCGRASNAWQGCGCRQQTSARCGSLAARQAGRAGWPPAGILPSQQHPQAGAGCNTITLKRPATASPGPALPPALGTDLSASGGGPHPDRGRGACRRRGGPRLCGGGQASPSGFAPPPRGLGGGWAASSPRFGQWDPSRPSLGGSPRSVASVIFSPLTSWKRRKLFFYSNTCQECLFLTFWVLSGTSLPKKETH